MNETEWQKWFETIWADREEHWYRAFFGDTGPGIYPIPESAFAAIGVADPDPRYFFHGVFECPPSEKRDHWAYVTSGMSNPWGDSPETVTPEGLSGLGYEFVLHTRERARWAILLLHGVMAMQLGIASAKIEGELLQRNDRVGLGGPIGAAREGGLTHLLATGSDAGGLLAQADGANTFAGQIPRYPMEFRLTSGRVELLLLLGITAREAEFAQTQGVEGLLQVLCHHGIFPLTDPGRQSVV